MIFSVVLDLRKKTIEFQLNGKSMGIAFKNIPKGPYVFVADVYSGESIRIVRSNRPPKKDRSDENSDHDSEVSEGSVEGTADED